MLAESVSVNESVLNLIVCVKTQDEYLGKCLDIFANMEIPYQRAMVSYFNEEIENPVWEEMAEDEMLSIEFMKAVVAFYSGRKVFDKEPDRFQLIEMFEGFLESKHCHKVVNKKSSKKMSKLIKGLG